MKSPVLRHSRRLIKKEALGAGSEREAERAWSTSPCVSHGDSVAGVMVEVVEEDGRMVEEEDGKMVEEDDELLAVPLADYDDNEENSLETESPSSPSSTLPYSRQGHYKVGMYPSSAAIANWRHPATGFDLKKSQS